MINNTNKLKGKIKEVYGTVGAFTEAVNMSETTFRNKLNNVRDFGLEESITIKNKLNLTKEEYTEIFFGNKLD